jgi:CheY-like chemotaxis protein
MRIAVRPADATGAEIRVLVADDDDGVRQLFAILLRTTPGVSSVIEAKDGAEAVELACGRQFDVAVLDLNMPRLDGVQAAIRLRAMQPSLKIALNSSSPELLRQRADGLGLPLFDKIVDFDRLREWVAQQSQRARAVREVHPLLRSAPRTGRSISVVLDAATASPLTRRPRAVRCADATPLGPSRRVEPPGARYLTNDLPAERRVAARHCLGDLAPRL